MNLKMLIVSTTCLTYSTTTTIFTIIISTNNALHFITYLIASNSSSRA